MPIRVLLADDHAIVRDGLRALLEPQADFEVVAAAADGREAVRLAARLHPDVAVMDIAMPGLNGLEATEQIADHTPATQVIILSMHAAPEHIFRALRAGARGYVLKDAAGAELFDALRAVHAGRRYLSHAISEAVIDDYLSQRRRAHPLEALSAREREVLQLTAEGRSTAEIARLLALSPRTVETYRSRLMQKLGLADLPALVKFAIQHGLTSLE
jgi:DNA-binding NarL/FixJ family response regulator